MRLAPVPLAVGGASVLSAAMRVDGYCESSVRRVICEDLQRPDLAQFRMRLDQRILPGSGAKAACEPREYPLPRRKWARGVALVSRFFGSVRLELAIDRRRYALGRLSEITQGKGDQPFIDASASLEKAVSGR
jgi:hypothetical protein